MTKEEIKDDEENYSPYCKICEACGHTGCCNPNVCMQHPEGDYCERYLKELKMTWAIYNSLMNWIDERKEQYTELLKKDSDLTNEKYDKYFPEEKPNSSTGFDRSVAENVEVVDNADKQKI